MKKRLKFTTYLAILNLILISDLKGDINAVFRGRGIVMEEELRYFVAYLENIRKASHNTVMSYHSDLTKMIAYLHGQGMDSVSAVRTTHLNSYVLLLEKDGMAAATISRYIASMKGFFVNYRNIIVPKKE